MKLQLITLFLTCAWTQVLELSSSYTAPIAKMNTENRARPGYTKMKYHPSIPSRKARLAFGPPMKPPTYSMNPKGIRAYSNSDSQNLKANHRQSFTLRKLEPIYEMINVLHGRNLLYFLTEANIYRAELDEDRYRVVFENPNDLSFADFQIFCDEHILNKCVPVIVIESIIVAPGSRQSGLASRLILALSGLLRQWSNSPLARIELYAARTTLQARQGKPFVGSYVWAKTEGVQFKHPDSTQMKQSLLVYLASEGFSSEELQSIETMSFESPADFADFWYSRSGEPAFQWGKPFLMTHPWDAIYFPNK